MKAAQSARLAHELPEAELRITPGAGHMPLHYAPEDVVAALDRIDATAGARRGATAEPGEASSVSAPPTGHRAASDAHA